MKQELKRQAQMKLSSYFLPALLALLLCAVSPRAAAFFDVIEFMNNSDDTATLVVQCLERNNARVTFRVKIKQIDSLNIGQIYDVIRRECGQ